LQLACGQQFLINLSIIWIHATTKETRATTRQVEE